MSVKELKLDCLGGKLYFSMFAGQICVLPIVEKVGDQICMNDHQAKFLLLYLQEHLNER